MSLWLEKVEKEGSITPDRAIVCWLLVTTLGAKVTNNWGKRSELRVYLTAAPRLLRLTLINGSRGT